MTWTYAGSPGLATAAQRRDLVRLTLGDTVSGYTPTLTDEEIAYYLGSGVTESTVTVSSINAGKALLARFARDVNFTRSKVSVDASDRYRMLKDLITDLESGTFALATSGPYLGGESKADADNAREDTDFRQPFYTANDHDQPWNPPGGLPLLGE